jgi:tyrosinase
MASVPSIVRIDIPGTLPDGRTFIGWSPVQATARLVPPLPPLPFPLPGPQARVPITLSNSGSVGRVRFGTQRTGNGTTTLQLDLPVSGAAVSFWVGGDFGRPSQDHGDAMIEAKLRATPAATLGVKPLMVRVRKNAVTLTNAERDRFLAAMGTLNGRGLGRFTDFRLMHTAPADLEEHGGPGFLPWHRAYILDLERELQAIDPRVALPYWRFDQPAPQLFTLDYLGAPGPTGFVQLRPGHPLEHWTTDLAPGILREITFDVNNAPHRPISEADTLRLGGTSNTYASFRNMEGNPHGSAHVSFNGFIRSPSTAPRDPLFFLLHCNVDRLWAKWQWLFRRHDPAVSQSFSNGTRIGHRLPDTMWPWNGSITPPRPPFAPGGAFAASDATTLPGPTPTVRAMLDYQGKVGGTSLAFDYDDVPFEN